MYPDAFVKKKIAVLLLITLSILLWFEEPYYQRNCWAKKYNLKYLGNENSVQSTRLCELLFTESGRLNTFLWSSNFMWYKN